MPQGAAIIDHPFARSLCDLAAIARAPVYVAPYPHLIASNVLLTVDAPALHADFPEIKRPGFFPLSQLSRQGSFDRLARELEAPELADVLTQKFGIELRNKPRLITVRKWSAGQHGRIHNDSEAKIFTALLYLNPTWQAIEGGRLRVLRDAKDFNNMAAEISPLYGNFLAFRRTENSWHGHKPFTGERRVIQITWLRSEEDLKRKERRSSLSHFFKKLLPFSGDYK
jgi:SM-20-related protein